MTLLFKSILIIKNLIRQILIHFNHTIDFEQKFSATFFFQFLDKLELLSLFLLDRLSSRKIRIMQGKGNLITKFVLCTYHS